MSEPDRQLLSSEVSILLEPDWKQQLVKDYAKDRKMKHLIERLKKNDGLQNSYRWNTKEGRLDRGSLETMPLETMHSCRTYPVRVVAFLS